MGNVFSVLYSVEVLHVLAGGCTVLGEIEASAGRDAHQFLRVLRGGVRVD